MAISSSTKVIHHIMLVVLVYYGNIVIIDTNWDGHHDGGVVGWCGQFPLSEYVLSGWVFLNDLH